MNITNMLDKLHLYIPQLSIMIGMIWIIYSAHKSTNSFNVFDYLIDPTTNKASITKTLQIVAGLTATWIVCRMAINNNLTTEFFTVYLAALGVSEAWSKFIGAKYGSTDKETK